jgi:hypothetical protein
LLIVYSNSSLIFLQQLPDELLHLSPHRLIKVEIFFKSRSATSLFMQATEMPAKISPVQTGLRN